MYRFVAQLLEPYTFFMLGLLGTTIWTWRTQHPRSRPIITTSILLGILLVLSTPVVGYWALGSLEWSYPPTSDVPAMNDTIVVLSAGVLIDDDTGKQLRLGDATLNRCLHAARLYRKAGGCRMILSGGAIDPSIPGPTFAAAMRAFMLEMGVRPEDIIVEDKSATTYENARYSKPLLQDVGKSQTWLVTEAAHMYRSERCFRAQGMSVIPAACDHHVWRRRFSACSLLPCSKAIAEVGRAAYEWTGFLWYLVRGRI